MFKAIDMEMPLEAQFEAFCASVTPPTYQGEQVAAWSRSMAWVEGDGEGEPTGMYAGRVANNSPLCGEILMWKDLGRC